MLQTDAIEAGRNIDVASSDRVGLDTRNEPPGDARRNADAEGAQDGGGAADLEDAHRKRRPAVLIVGFLLLAGLVLGAFYFWYTGRNIESTDDAYTDGRAIAIAPQVSGIVVSLDVTDNQFVRKGDPLIHIDPRPYTAERDQAQGVLDAAKAQIAGEQLLAEIGRKNFPALLQQAQAQLQSAKASLSRAQADYDRQRSLPKAATTQQDVDAALAILRQSQAQVLQAEAQVLQNSPVEQRISQTDTQVAQQKGLVEQAQAQLDQKALNLSWTVVTAPQDGWVTRRNVEVGTYVTPGQQIFSIVSPEVWVTANFKETQLDSMRPGQSVKIKVDAYPHLDLRGHVDSIQMGSGTKFTAFPPENATGNFVKIVQRVPVKLVIDSGLDPELPLPLGISVVPTVTVR
jgi:membrane fusion protein, multidrug efflux system